MPPLKGSWVPHDTRDDIVDYVRYWTDRAETPSKQILAWTGLGSSKFYDWKKRYGKVNEHNGLVPRDWWLEEWEKKAIIDFHEKHPLEGYRRLTFMMLDADTVAVRPASVYRVLNCLLKKGSDPLQPLGFHRVLGVLKGSDPFFNGLLSRPD